MLHRVHLAWVGFELTKKINMYDTIFRSKIYAAIKETYFKIKLTIDKWILKQRVKKMYLKYKMLVRVIWQLSKYIFFKLFNVDFPYLPYIYAILSRWLPPYGKYVDEGESEGKKITFTENWGLQIHVYRERIILFNNALSLYLNQVYVGLLIY